MKHLLVMGLLLSSTSVFASKLANIKTMTNPKVETARTTIAGLDLVTHSASKKVLSLSGNGKTQQDLRQNTVAQSLHTLCPFFDDGVRIGLNKKDDNGVKNAALDLIDSSNVAEGDAEFNTLVDALKLANAETGVEIYSGVTSGNNTVGSVLGIYDTKNNELSVFASTNCGSDD